MNNNASFNWFPGHMNKSVKEIEKQIKIVDLIAYVVDARAPISTQNFIFKNILKNKKIVYLLSKSDIADENITNKWLNFFNKNEKTALLIKKNSSNNRKLLIDFIIENLRNVFEHQKKQGYEKMNANVLVIGIPNVGKSTFINSLSIQKKVNAGNTPGLTRGLQRIKLNDEITLIDSPGINLSKFFNNNQAMICAMSNCLKIFDDYKWDIIFYCASFFLKKYINIFVELFGPIDFNIEDFNENFLYDRLIKLNSEIYKNSINDPAQIIEKILIKLTSYQIKNVSFESPNDEW